MIRVIHAAAVTVPGPRLPDERAAVHVQAVAQRALGGCCA